MAYRISITPPNGCGSLTTTSRESEVSREILSELPRALAQIQAGGAPVMIEVTEVPDGW